MEFRGAGWPEKELCRGRSPEKKSSSRVPTRVR